MEPPVPTGGTDLELTDDEKLFAALAHALTFGLPILAPGLIYLLKKDESPYVAYHAIQALILQSASMALTFFVLIPCYLVSLGMCFPVLFVSWVPLIYGIYMAVQAYGGTRDGYVGIDQFGRPEDW